MLKFDNNSCLASSSVDQDLGRDPGDQGRGPQVQGGLHSQRIPGHGHF